MTDGDDGSCSRWEDSIDTLRCTVTDILQKNLNLCLMVASFIIKDAHNVSLPKWSQVCPGGVMVSVSSYRRLKRHSELWK